MAEEKKYTNFLTHLHIIEILTKQTICYQKYHWDSYLLENENQ